MAFVNMQQEKEVLINNLRINYKIFGNGNIPIILLHGWGINSDKYVETANQLVIHDSRFMILVLDLPGFGKSNEPSTIWGVDDYVELIKNFSNNLKLENIILIGHSFGGRIAIKFAAKYPEKIKALILTGAAGIKRTLTVKQKTFYYLAKIGKIFFSLPLISKFEKLAQKVLYKATGEKDYYNAQGVMKETFKKVIAEDLTPSLEKINKPTLLVWGENDLSTPISDAYIMKERIKKSELVIIEKANHGVPYKNPDEFSKIASNFIKKG